MSEINFNLINEWNVTNKNIPLQNAITQNDLSKLVKNWDTFSKNNFLFNHSISKEPKITNQKSSGRCWMFAGLNVLRINFIKKYNLPKDFEFSQTHLFFYDKLERANVFLNNIINKSDLPIDDRYMQCILESPLGDGGYWHTFSSLVDKYGLVPKNVHPETYHSSYSSRMNFVLGFQLRQFAKQLRESKNKNNDKMIFLKEYHRLLTLFLGTPVLYFDWCYYDKDDKYNKMPDLTPKDFAKLCEWNVNDFIVLSNDPRNEYEKKMIYKDPTGCTKNVVYYNVKMDELVKWTQKSILKGCPVWHGCDVKKWLDGDKDCMNLDLVDYDNLLNINFTMSKKDQMEYGISCPTHAMTFVGFESNDNGDEIGEIKKWKVENSWSSKGNNDGYYVMSQKWFIQYVYEVVIPKWILDEETLKKFNDCKEYIELQPWDAMAKELK